MSYPLDSDVQEDVRTFPMYQRLRKKTHMHITHCKHRNRCNLICATLDH